MIMLTNEILPVVMPLVVFSTGLLEIYLALTDTWKKKDEDR